VKNSRRWFLTFCLTLFCVVASSLNPAYAQSTPPQPLFPKYFVMGVVYAPPGSASFVTYGSSNLVGSSNTISNSTSSTVVNSSSFSAGATLGMFGASISYDQSDGWTTSSQNSNSVAVQTTTGNAIATMGPISSSLGVNHDNDIIYIWLNPVASGTAANLTSINWTNLSANSCDLTDSNDVLTFYQTMSGCDPNQFPYPDIVGIPVWCLKNPYWPGQGCAQWLPYTSRSWDLSYWGPQPTNQNGAALPSLAPGLTLQDYADILQADPFVTMNVNSFNVCHFTYGPNMDPNNPETVIPVPNGSPTLARPPSFCVPAPSNYSLVMTRFQPYGTVEYPEPGPNGLPSTYTGYFQYSLTNTQGATAIDTHTSTSSWFTTASFGDSFFGGLLSFDAAASYGSSNTSTWQQQNSTTSTQGNTSTASYSITGPQLSDNYTGPATYNVYLDNVYGTFAFYSPLEPKVNLGYISISPYPTYNCPGAGAEPSLTFPQEPITTPPTASAPQTVFLTNCSPYPLTMVWPAVSFSDPGFQIANDGKDYCSNQVIQPQPQGGSGGYGCSLDVVFAPVTTDGPNTIYGTTYPVNATMIAAGTENAASYQNILVTNPATVSAVAAVGTTTQGATLLPTGTGQPQDPKEPNVVTFVTPTNYTAQTQIFTFKNYYNSDINFYPAYGGIYLSDVSNFTLLNNTCYSQTSMVIIHSLGTCTFTLQYLPAPGPGTQQSGILSTKITAVATVGDSISPGIPMATAGAAGPGAITLTPSPVTFNVTGTKTNPIGWYTPLTLTNNTNFTVTGLTGQNSNFGAYVNGFFAANCPASLLKGASCTVEVYTTDYVLHNGKFYGTITVSGTLQTTGSPTISANINATADVLVTGTMDANIVLTGAEQSETVQVPATYAKGSVVINPLVIPAAGSGTLSSAVGTFNATASYAAGASGDAAAKAMVADLNVAGSPVKATTSGSIIALKSIVAGSAGNLALGTTGDANFQLLSSGATLTGGKDATTKTKYDGGTIDVTTAGVTASATWGSKSTPQSIAKALAASINRVAGAYWKAIASGDVVALTSVSQTPPSITVTVNDLKGFTPASFAGTTN
jgi:hypothetical protein